MTLKIVGRKTNLRFIHFKKNYQRLLANTLNKKIHKFVPLKNRFMTKRKRHKIIKNLFEI